MQLRPYQQQLEADVYAAWESGARNVLAVAPTGSGKTVLFSDILRKHRGASIAVAHRHELVTQISLALARAGVRHRVIGAATLPRACVQLHMAEIGRSYYDSTALVGVAGVDTLVRVDGSDPWLRQVTLGVQDECFPAGTLVDGRPIESLRVGDFVTAFDEETGAVDPRRIVRTFRSVKPKKMVRVSTDAHHVLECTEGHPFFTRRGWVTAADLTIRDEVLTHDMYSMRRAYAGTEGASALPVQENRPGFLHEEMRPDVPRRAPEATSETGAARGSVHHLRKTGRPERASPPAMEEDGPGVLRAGMLVGVPGETILRDDGSDKSSVRLETDDREKPDAPAGDTGEGIRNAPNDWAQAGYPGREREATKRGRSYATDAVRRTGVHGANGDQDGGETREPGETAAVLQAGPGEYGFENCDRSRREQSQSALQARTRREKRGVLTWARVDRVEVYERGDIDPSGTGGEDSFVYNIEVEDFHTYIAGGVVVHNCHHMLRGNKWGSAVELLPNARWLGVTATPLRADGKGLGRHADGIMDVMVVAPGMRDLIRDGYLTDYRIFAPPSDLDLSAVPVSAGGDYSPDPLRKAVHRSHIVGDVVGHYRKIAAGKLGVTFAVDVESAAEIAAAYRAAGVPAEVVSAKTPDLVRAQILRRFARRELIQLVNVDLFGEGFDLPAIEVVSMARPTQSYGLYVQQFGRALRIMDGKDYAIIIDHVGNVHRHGLPDAPREWTLDRRDKRGSNKPVDVIPIRTCPECAAAYERTHLACPYCGHAPTPAGRSAPEQVDGDLHELTPEALARLRGEVEAAGALRIPYGAKPEVIGALQKHHRLRVEAQADLREAMAAWAGARTQAVEGSDELRRVQREFFHRFGVDYLRAQALGRADAEALRAKIEGVKEVTRTCALPGCGAKFTVVHDRPDQRYCCPGHGHEANRKYTKAEPRKCALEGCEVVFTPSPSDPGRYCCREHVREAQRKHPEVEPRKCALEGCEKVFTPKADAVARGAGKYCCREHAYEARRRAADPSPRACLECGVVFTPNRKKRDQVYCCGKCAAIGWRKHKTARAIDSTVNSG